MCQGHAKTSSVVELRQLWLPSAWNDHCHLTSRTKADPRDSEPRDSIEVADICGSKAPAHRHGGCSNDSGVCSDVDVIGCEISPEARAGPGAEKIERDHRNRIEHHLDERLTSPWGAFTRDAMRCRRRCSFDSYTRGRSSIAGIAFKGGRPGSASVSHCPT